MATDSFDLKLYVLEETQLLLERLDLLQQSLARIENTSAKVDVVNLNHYPEEAMRQQIVAIPTLIKNNPPSIRVVGNIEDIDRITRILTRQY